MANIEELFPRFSHEIIKLLEEHASLHTIPEGTMMMRTGQYVKNTILVLKGKIKIYREDEDGGEFFMYYLQPGQACAISMICATKNETSQITAKVMEEAEVIMIPLQLMDKWMMEHRSWYEFVLDTYRKRFEEVLLVIDSIAFKAMDERLEIYLQRQKEACLCDDIHLSHQEIATDLNTSREVISRLLKKMEQKGLIQLHRNHISFV